MTISMIFTVLGLIVFEVISSIDNAVVNAEVLSTMSKKARRWFLLWGLLFAVFIVRGLLPWLIVWLATPGLGPIQAFTATFSNDPKIFESIHKASPILLTGGGTFLILLFFHWLFQEKKEFGLRHEKYFQSKGIWFFAVASIVLLGLVWLAGKKDFMMAFAAVAGSTAFFITHGFKQNAEMAEAKLVEGTSNLSDVSKIVYLEIIDTTFSIDGVLGAFAFTLSVPLIIIGNGIGALVLRQLTVSNIENIKKYRYLKNGAMYSILVLGAIMVMHAFGAHIPEYVSPLVTVIIVGYFFWKSHMALKGITV